MTFHEANINIVAIHQHITGEDPRMVFLHYYGLEWPGKLGQGTVTPETRK
jgi:uncharacterized protein DUF1259